MENKDGMFRQSALERLSSPERLDQLMQVVNPMDWIALTTLASLVGGTLIWSIVGRIPITVDGRGVLIQPRQVVDFQANITGQLKALNVRNGQCVKKNEVLATVDPIDLKQQLSLSQGKLAQLETQAQSTSAVSVQRMRFEKSSLDATRVSLIERLGDTRSLTPILQSKGVDALQEKRRSMEQRLGDAQKLVPVMEQRLASRQKLVEEGALPRDLLLQVDQEYVQSRQTVADIKAQLKQLDVETTQTDRQYLENLRSAGDLQAQLQDLDTKAKRLDQETLETQNQRQREIQEVSRETTRLKQQITTNSQILSPQDGCILEVSAAMGQVVQPGLRLGSMQMGAEGGALTGIVYLPIKDGKQVKAGMSIAITPDTVQRERFGGIVAEITDVSKLPVTRAGATAVVGNSEVVQGLVGETGAVIEVNTKLITDANTVSGYKWSSSKGPESKITSGTTTNVRITVEDRPPITFVMPFLRDLLGLK